MLNTASAVVDAALRDDSLTSELTRRFAVVTGQWLAQAIDGVSREIAERFLRGDIEYWPADYVMNELWGLMLAADALPPLAYRIYDAFDAGEFNRPDGTDPVEAFVRPALREALDLD